MPLKTYRCHKEVKAMKIGGISPIYHHENDLVVDLYAEAPGTDPVTVTELYCKKHNPKVGGYYVLYKDGYESFSPAEAFKDGYTEVCDK